MTARILTEQAIRAIIGDMVEQGIAELGLSMSGGEELRLSRSPGRPSRSLPPPAGNAERLPAAGEFVRSPGAGELLMSFPGGTEEAVRPGTHSAAGAIVAFLRVGAILRPIAAPSAGRVGNAVASDGDLVGYGSPIFEFAPDEP